MDATDQVPASPMDKKRKAEDEAATITNAAAVAVAVADPTPIVEDSITQGKPKKRNTVSIATVMGEVRVFLGPTGQIRGVDCVEPFVKHMKDNSAADVGVLTYYANVLVATRPPPILAAFLDSTGPLILRAWHARCLKTPKSDPSIRLMRQILQIYRALPLTLASLADLKLGKLVVRTSSTFTDEQVARLASVCEQHWRELLMSAKETPQESLSQPEVVPHLISAPIIADPSTTSADSPGAPIALSPSLVINSASSSEDSSNLPAPPPPPPKLPSVTSRPINLAPQARKTSGRKIATPRPIVSILRKQTDSPKESKSVRFPPSSLLVQVKEFVIDPEERRLSSSKKKSLYRRPHDMDRGEAKAAFAPWESSTGGTLGQLLPWSHPSELLLPTIIPPIIPGVASLEVSIQKDRERSVLAVHYNSEEDVPPSPDESLISPYFEEDLPPSIPWSAQDAHMDEDEDEDETQCRIALQHIQSILARSATQVPPPPAPLY